MQRSLQWWNRLKLGRWNDSLVRLFDSKSREKTKDIPPAIFFRREKKR